MACARADQVLIFSYAVSKAVWKRSFRLTTVHSPERSAGVRRQVLCTGLETRKSPVVWRRRGSAVPPAAAQKTRHAMLDEPAGDGRISVAWLGASPRLRGTVVAITRILSSVRDYSNLAAENTTDGKVFLLCGWAGRKGQRL